MEDSKIIDLYWERNEKAISATEQKYGSYCYYIAYNILHDQEDADESVNDTYLGAWNAIPPHRPNMLRTFLGKITRSISLKKWRDAHRDKRGGDEVSLVLDELSECVPSNLSGKRTEADKRSLVNEAKVFCLFFIGGNRRIEGGQ